MDFPNHLPCAENDKGSQDRGKRGVQNCWYARQVESLASIIELVELLAALFHFVHVQVAQEIHEGPEPDTSQQDTPEGRNIRC